MQNIPQLNANNGATLSGAQIASACGNFSLVVVGEGVEMTPAHAAHYFTSTFFINCNFKVAQAKGTLYVWNA